MHLKVIQVEKHYTCLWLINSLLSSWVHGSISHKTICTTIHKSATSFFFICSIQVVKIWGNLLSEGCSIPAEWQSCLCNYLSPIDEKLFSHSHQHHQGWHHHASIANSVFINPASVSFSKLMPALHPHFCSSPTQISFLRQGKEKGECSIRYHWRRQLSRATWKNGEGGAWWWQVAILPWLSERDRQDIGWSGNSNGKMPAAQLQRKHCSTKISLLFLLQKSR